jgi:hypothetical protein
MQKEYKLTFHGYQQFFNAAFWMEGNHRLSRPEELETYSSAANHFEFRLGKTTHHTKDK